MSSKPLTIKQEAFCQAYIETGNASEAYRSAYNTEKMKPESVNRCAKAMTDNIKIASRLKDLRLEAENRHHLTVYALIEELEEARALSLEIDAPNHAITATMGKAKLLGLDRHGTEADKDAAPPTRVEVIVRDASKSPRDSHAEP